MTNQAIPRPATTAQSETAGNQKRVSHGLATAFVLFGLVYGIVVNASPAIGDNRFFVSLNALRTDGGDEETVGRLGRTIAWCNDNLTQANVKLLLVGEARGFDFRMPIVYSTCFDVSPVEQLLRGKTTAQQLAALESAGATHLMVNWTEIARYRGPGNYGFSDCRVARMLKNWSNPACYGAWLGRFQPNLRNCSKSRVTIEVHPVWRIVDK